MNFHVHLICTIWVKWSYHGTIGYYENHSLEVILSRDIHLCHLFACKCVPTCTIPTGSSQEYAPRWLYLAKFSWVGSAWAGTRWDSPRFFGIDKPEFSCSHITHTLTPSPSQDVECLSFPDLYDGGAPSLHCSGGQRHPHAHREAAGHTVHVRGWAGSLSARTTLQAARKGHPPSCKSILCATVKCIMLLLLFVYTQGGLGSCLLYLDFFSIAPEVSWE